MTPSDILIWLNIVLTVGGFVTIYVRIIERITRMEVNTKHIMHKLKMGVRGDDNGR